MRIGLVLVVLAALASCRFNMSDRSPSGVSSVTSPATPSSTTATTAGGDTSLTSVTAGPAVKLAVNGLPPFQAGVCAGPFTITAIDAHGNVATPSNNTELFKLEGTPPNAIFIDVNCTELAPEGSVVSDSSGTRALFYVNGTQAYSKVIAVNGAGVTGTFGIQILSGTPTRLEVTAPAAVSAGDCFAGALSLVDKNGNVATATKRFSAGVLIHGLSNAGVFSDPQCSQPLATLDFSVGTSSQPFHFLTQSPGTGSLAAQAPSGLEGGSANLTVFVENSPQLGLIPPPGQMVAGLCSAFRIVSLDTAGNTLVTHNGLPVTVSSKTSQLVLFSDAACSTPLNPATVTLAAESSTNQFFARSELAHTGQVAVSASGYLSATVAPIVAPAPAVSLSLDSLPDSLTMGGCMTAVVRSKDPFGNVSTVPVGVPILISGSGTAATGTNFYAGGSCTTSATKQFTLGNGSSLAAFSFSPGSPGALTITLTPSGLTGSGGATSTSGTTTIAPSPTVRLSLSSSTSAIIAGLCAKMSLSTIDAAGTVTMAPIDTSVTLSNDQSLQPLFFSDASCSSATSNLIVRSGTSSADFYIQSTKINAIVVSAQGTDSTGKAISTSKGVAIVAAAPSTLSIGSLGSAPSGKLCLGPVAVDTLDQFRNPAIVPKTTSFALESTGAVELQFSSNSTCSDSISSLTIPAGKGEGVFYAKAQSGGAVSFSILGGDLQGSGGTTLSDPPALHLVLAGPSSASATVGTCVAFQVGSVDPTNTPKIFDPNTITVGVTPTTNAVFFSDSSCATGLPNNQVTISPALNPAPFYFKFTTAQSMTISANGSLNSQGAGSQLTLTPANPSQIVLSPMGAGTFSASTCAGPYSAEAQDSFGNSSPVRSTLPFTFQPTGVSASFYSDAACSTSGAAIAAGKTSGLFYMKGAEPGSLTVSVGATSLHSSWRIFTVAADGAVKLTLLGQPVTQASFGSVSQGQTSSLIFTLTNSSTRTAASKIAVTVSSSSFSAALSTAPAGCSTLTDLKLAPGQQCGFGVLFTANSQGAASGSLDYTFSMGGASQSQSVSLSGTGTTPLAAVLTASAQSIDFGMLMAGQTTKQHVTVTNSGTRDASQISLSGVSAPFSASFESGCATLAPGSACDLTLAAAPSTSGSAQQTLVIDYSDGTDHTPNPSTVSLKETSNLPAVLQVSNSSLSFPATVVKGTSGAQTLTVTNMGSLPATEVSYSLSGSAFSLNSSSCPATLDAFTSCALSITFNPTALGSFSDVLSISYTSYAQAKATTVAIVSGDSTSPPHLIFNPALGTFAPTAINKAAPSVSLLLTNSGNGDAQGITLATSAPFSVNSTECSMLNAGQSCFVKVGFTPTAAGSFSSTLTANCSNATLGCAATTASLTGSTLPQSSLTLSATQLSFGLLTIGQTMTETITLSNSGALGNPAIQLSTPQLGGSNSAAALALTHSCGTTLASGSSCTVSVTFSPTNAGTFDNTLDIVWSSGNGLTTSTVGLSASALSAANVTLSPATSNFPDTVVGNTSQAIAVTVSNGGQSSAKDIVISGPTSVFIRSAATCPPEPFALAAGANCTVSYTFTPPGIGKTTHSFGGTFAGTSGATSIGNISFSGTGIATASLVVDETSLNFPPTSVGKSSQASLVFTNTGNGPASQINLANNLASPYFLSGPLCSSLAAGAQCTVTITFTPVAIGTFPSNVQVQYSDGSTLQKTSSISLTGTTGGKVNATPSTVSFSNVVVGQTNHQDVTITNNGAVSLSFLAAGIDPNSSPGFSVNPGACGTLSVGQSCEIVFSLSPNAVSNSLSGSSTVRFSDSVGNVVTAPPIALSGTSVGLAKLTVAPQSLTFSDTVIGTQSATQTLTITNTGVGQATKIAPALPADFLNSGGSCGASPFSLSPNAQCTISLIFKPTAAEDLSQAITGTYSNGVADDIFSFDVRGNGQTPGNLMLSVASLDFGSIALGTTSPLRSVTVSNTGGSAATQITILNLSPPFKNPSSSCGAQPFALAAGSSCELDYAFNPTSAGNSTEKLAVNYSNGVGSGTQRSLNLSGTGMGGSFSALPNPLNFNNTLLGQTGNLSVTVTNTGATNLNFAGAGINTGSGAGYSIANGNCGSLSTGATCSLTYSFTPTAISSSFSGSSTIQFTDNMDNAVSQVLPLSASSSGVGLLSSSKASLSFGDVTVGSSSAAQTFTVTNIGSGPATQISWSGPSPDFVVNYGSCGSNASLAAGAQCTVSLSLKPAAPGTFNQTLTVGYSDGQTTTTANMVTVSGRGLGPANLALSPSSLDFSGIAVGATSPTKLVTITNSGSATASNILLNPTLSGNSFTKVSSTCGNEPFVLAAGTNCQINLAFSPAVAGSASQIYSVSYSDSVSQQSGSTLTLNGTGIEAAVLTTNLSNVVFPYTALGQSSSATVVLTNAGGTDATQIALSPSTLPAHFSYGNSTCDSTLSPGATCSLTLNFIPKVSGTFTASLQITYNNGTPTTPTPPSISLTGTTAGAYSLTTASLDFGAVPVGSSKNLSLTVTNIGAPTITSSTPTMDTGSDAAFRLINSTCSTLASGQNCLITYSFQPTTAMTNAGGASTLAFTNPDNSPLPSTQVRMTASAPGVARITASPSTLAFGPIAVNGSSSPQTLTLTNAGTGPATQLAWSGVTNDFSIAFSTCPNGSALSVGAQCTISVTFRPTSAATFSQSLALSYFDGTANSNLIASTLTGQGVGAGVMALSPLSLDFGSVLVGQTKALNFAITNTGTGPITNVQFSSPVALPFATGSLCSSIQPGASCQLSTAFLPSAAGTFQATGQLSYYDGASAQLSPAFTLSGHTGPAFRFSPTSLSFGNVAYGTTSTAQAITITNTGGTSIKLNTILFDGQNSPQNGFRLVTSNCGTTLSPNGICTLSATFTPAAANSGYSSVWTISFVDAVTSSNPISGSIILSGSGTSPGALSANPASFSYGTVSLGSTANTTIVISNPGGTSTLITGVTALASPFRAVNQCTGIALAPSGTCLVQIAFTPLSGTTSSWQQNLIVSGQAGSTPVSVSVPISGNTTSVGALRFSPASVAFPATALNSFATMNVSLSNTGGTAITLGALPTLTPPYSVNAANCSGITLLPGSNCTLIITFTPVSGATNFNQTLTVAGTSGGVPLSASLPVSGSTLSSGVLTPSASTYNFGSLLAGQTRTSTITWTNTGGASLTATSASGLSSPFTLTANNCLNVTLQAGMSCSTTVTFTSPGGADMAWSQVLRLAYATAGTSATSSVTYIAAASATPGTFTPSPTSYNFGTISSGTSRSVNITWTNTGGATSQALSFTGYSAPITLTSDGCTGRALAVGGSCTTMFTFSPTTGGPSFTRTVIAQYTTNGAVLSSSITLAGSIAALPGTLTASPTSYNFGSLPPGGTGSSTVTWTNTGGSSLTIAPATGISSPFTLTSNSCSAATLLPGARCSTTVIFTAPFGTTTSWNQILRLSYSTNGASASTSVAYYAATTAPPGTLTPNTASYNFGSVSVGSAVRQCFTETNTGGAAITLPAVPRTLSIAGGFNIVVDSCIGSSLQPSQSCQVCLSFAPTIAGTMTATFSETFTNTDGTNTRSGGTIKLMGNGVAPSPSPTPTYGFLRITPTQYNFPATAVNYSKLQVFTVTNTGSGPATINNVQYGENPGWPQKAIVYSTNCCSGLNTTTGACTPTNLNPYSSCTVSLNFLPNIYMILSNYAFTVTTNLMGVGGLYSGQSVMVQGSMGVLSNPPTSGARWFATSGSTTLHAAVGAQSAATTVVLQSFSTTARAPTIPGVGPGFMSLSANYINSPFLLTSSCPIGGSVGSCYATVRCTPRATGSVTLPLTATFSDGTPTATLPFTCASP
ncbi:MAG: choice-of-anchor D domain-containing protein [Deltaproteobacteria bacterium]|nr:choice-of-anchor D domain-containing protein [Deltaproteobacteria bacterium]